MLYEGIDKNISTLSTTPNPSGSLTFPGLSTKSPAQLSGKSSSKRSSIDKPLFPSLSHYSSLPLFHLVKFPNGDVGTLGKYGPHVALNPIQWQTHRHTYSYPPLQSTIRSPLPSSTQSPPSKSPSVPPATYPLGNPDVATLSSTSLASPIHSGSNVDEIENTALYTSPASTTVRSSTLATIQEESESGKGSPKGPTPMFQKSTAEVMSPPLNKFGGSLSFVHDVDDVDSRKLEMGSDVEGNLSVDKEGKRSEEAVPLGPVCTGEFTPNLQLLEEVKEPAGQGQARSGMTLEPENVSILEDMEGNNLPGIVGLKDLVVKSEEFQGTLTDEIEETFAEIGALAKARASKAQFRLGFD